MINKVALKVEQGSSGPPVGMQVVARHWREHVAAAAMQVTELEVAKRAEFIPGGVRNATVRCFDMLHK